MASLNKVILIGNLGANPELKYLPSGQAVCEMRIATTDAYTDKQGQKQERTEWHRIVVWGKQAETSSKYLSKGRSCCVEGRLQTRQWEDKDGNKRYTTEIVADRVVFLGGGGERQGGDERQGGGERQGGAPRRGGGDEPPDFGGPPAGNEDDIPF